MHIIVLKNNPDSIYKSKLLNEFDIYLVNFSAWIFEYHIYLVIFVSHKT